MRHDVTFPQIKILTQNTPAASLARAMESTPLLLPPHPRPGLVTRGSTQSVVSFTHVPETPPPPPLHRYLAYYLPALEWIPAYKGHNLPGDLVAGVVMTAVQVPLAVSFASLLARTSPVCGLVSIVVGPVVYAFFGGVPRFTVGPVGGILLIIGQALEEARRSGPLDEALAVCVLSLGVGAVLLGSGLARLGFLEHVLSRALLRGFVAAMGLNLISTLLVTEMGLQATMAADSHPHVTPLLKLVFCLQHARSAHLLTAAISLGAFLVVLGIRRAKPYLPPAVRLFPELLFVMVITTVASTTLDLSARGVATVGHIESGSILLTNPFSHEALGLFHRFSSTIVLSAVLGFLECTTASVLLLVTHDFSVSANRELVAFGILNIITSLVSGLPLFGVLGRSKLNIASGARTPMAGVVMALCSLACLLPVALSCFFHLPLCVLSLALTVVGLSLIEDAPADLRFFWNIRGYDEILVFAAMFLVCIGWSSEAGVVLGVGLAVVRVLRQGTHSRIQVLGRVPNTNAFRNADELVEESFEVAGVDKAATGLYQYGEETGGGSMFPNYASLELRIQTIEGCLVVKIPEPLTFANVGSLTVRLRRLDMYGSLLPHPATTRRVSSTKALVVDLKGMLSMDLAATQGLHEVVTSYQKRGVLVLFARVPGNAGVRERFAWSGIQEMVNSEVSRRVRGGVRRSVWGLQSPHNSVENLRGLMLDEVVATSMGPGFYYGIDEAVGVAMSVERE